MGTFFIFGKRVSEAENLLLSEDVVSINAVKKLGIKVKFIKTNVKYLERYKWF